MLFRRISKLGSRARTAAVVLSCIPLYLLASNLIWHAIFVGIKNGGAPGNLMKNWYLGDQLSYLSITSNVSAGRAAYTEPIMLDGQSIYPSGYYWLLGIVAKVLGWNPFQAWNIVGFAVLIALMVVAGYWGARLSRNQLGWFLGPLPVVIGTLEWWSSSSWR